MGFAGLIFGAVAALWLLYLVPLILNRRENGFFDEVEPGEQAFSASVTIVRRGTELDSAEAGSAVVSTPLNRRAALRELADIDREAARRRRYVLLFLLLTTTLLAVAAALGWVDWWHPLIPVGLIVIFLVIARFSVKAMRRDLDRRAERIRGGDCVHEETVEITVLEPQHEARAVGRDHRAGGGPRITVGSDPDNGTDVREQAAGPQDRSHDRSVGAGPR